MKSIVLCLAAMLTLSPAMGTPPMKPPPVEETLQEFKKSELAKIEGLCRDLQKRLPASMGKAALARLEDMRASLKSLKIESLSGLEYAIEMAEKEKILDYSEYVAHDLGFLRRSVDSLVVEASTEKSLQLDETLLIALRQFWETEQHYHRRFSEVRASATDDEKMERVRTAR